jgi:hypothetical protein
MPALFSLPADDFRTVLAVKGSLRCNQRRANADDAPGRITFPPT